MDHNPSTSPERKSAIKMTIDSIGRDMLSAMVDELRNQQDVWQKLSEQQQADTIDRLTKRVKSNVQTAVHLIASNGNNTVVADLEQVAIKDGVKAVFKVDMGNPAIEDIFNGVGKPFLLAVSRAAELTGGMDAVKPDPDQPNLYDDLDGDGVFADVSELQQAYEDGYEAAKNGYDKADCPDFAEAMRIEWCNGFNAFCTGSSEEPVRTMKQGQPPNENGVYLVEDEVIVWSHKKDNLEIKLLELENGQWIYSVATQFGTSGSSSPLTFDDHAALSRDHALLKAQEDLKRIVGNSGLTGAALSSLDAFIDGLWHSDEHVA